MFAGRSRHRGGQNDRFLWGASAPGGLTSQLYLEQTALRRLRCVSDLERHLFAQDRQRGLDLLCFRGVLWIQHAPDRSFVNPKAPRQFRVTDFSVAHRQVKR